MTMEAEMPIRVVRGIGKHYPTRGGEWAMAGTLTAIGVYILLPGDVFAIPQLSVLASLVEETQWGGFCFVVGMLRLTALIVNGTLYDIEELRISRNPVARALVWYSRY